MTMEWNNRDYQFDFSGGNGGNGEGSFQQHNESMREFRRSHADVAMVNGPRLDESALMERMELLRVRHTMMETGGSALPNDTADRSPLVPMWKVARYKLSQN